MISLRNSLISLLFISALTLTAWSILLSTHSKLPTSNKDSDLPDAFMENVTATIMNKQGAPSLKVATPKMVHYFTNDMTHIIKPNVTVYRNSPQPWFINSDYAVATAGTTQIEFQDHVFIHHPADISNPVTTLQTKALTVFTDKQIATTNQPVVIQQPDTLVHGIGMIANLNDGTVRLLSEAQGQYVPKS